MATPSRALRSLLLFSVALAWLPAAAHAAACSGAGIQAIAPPGATITAAVEIAAAAPIPEHCRVDGFVATPGNTVSFRLALPTAAWNGKLYFPGNGGYAGSLVSLDAGLARGYASVTTDTGHQAGPADASWALENLPKKIDYGYRGVHVVAVAAKSLTRAFYGTGPRFSYFDGCSNGGRQAMMEAQRFPEDFDGVIAGDPELGDLQTGFNWNMQALLATPQSYLPAGKLALITNAALAECDGKDGLVDGLIDDPRRCRFDPASLRCEAGDAPTCLTDGQIEAVKKIYAGPVTSDGGRLFPGFTVGSEAGPGGWDAWISGTVPPFVGPDGALWLSSAQSALNVNFVKYLAFDDPGFRVTQFDFDRDPALLAKSIGPILDPSDPDLSPFQERGAKLIMYHGWADPALTPLRTVDYHRAVVTTLEHRSRVLGHVKTDDFFRLFMVPGMYHCGGGPGPNAFDALTALENWVEHGAAPDRIIATKFLGDDPAQGIERTRPLCPYPQVARYRGAGSIDDAASFECGLHGLDHADEAAGVTPGAQGRDGARSSP